VGGGASFGWFSSGKNRVTCDSLAARDEGLQSRSFFRSWHPQSSIARAAASALIQLAHGTQKGCHPIKYLSRPDILEAIRDARRRGH
jgi:hypothetical protein